MAFRLYVGNYPFTFSKEDIQNLFRDFEGVEVEKQFCLKEKSKCYAFLTCNSIDQLVCVIKKMNRMPVSGRDLIVRASDQNLQEYVSLILQNEDTSVTKESSPMKVSSPVKVLRNKYRPQHRKSDSEKSDIHNTFAANSKQFEKSSKTEHSFGAISKHFEKWPPKNEDNFEVSEKKSISSSRSMHNVYQQKNNVNDCKTSSNNLHFSSKVGNMQNNQAYLRSSNQSCKSNAYSSESLSDNYQSSGDKNEHEYFEASSNHYFESQKNYQQTTRQKNTGIPGNITPESQKYCQPKSERYDHDKFNNFSENLYDSTSDIVSQTSKHENAEHFYKQRETSSPTWVSVTNFQIGLNANVFYDLFSDYKPLRVKMICNVPRKDKMLTEAHVCFPDREIADDVIFNFDNTVLEGRVILVNDIEDLTIMKELLNISHS